MAQWNGKGVRHEKPHRDHLPAGRSGVLFRLADGELLGFSSYMCTPVPQSLNAKLTRHQAIKRSAELLQSKRMYYGKIKKTALLIVVPTNVWMADKEHPYMEQPYSRLAWVIDYEAYSPRPGLPYGIGEMLIDAENGKVLGRYLYT